MFIVQQLRAVTIELLKLSGVRIQPLSCFPSSTGKSSVLTVVFRCGRCLFYSGCLQTVLWGSMSAVKLLQSVVIGLGAALRWPSQLLAGPGCVQSSPEQSDCPVGGASSWRVCFIPLPTMLLLCSLSSLIQFRSADRFKRNTDVHNERYWSIYFRPNSSDLLLTFIVVDIRK